MTFTSKNQPANRGRKKGSVNATTALIRKATPGILKKLIESAIDGDIQAATTLLKYSMPSIKPENNRITINVPEGASLVDKADLILCAVLSGKCCPTIGSSLITALSGVFKMKEQADFMERLEALENEHKTAA